MKAVYLETSVFSYLTARPSRDLRGGAIPKSATDDALHVATAAVHGMDYLLTWNCSHIDNAERKPAIRAVCAAEGYSCPEICTPEELMGEAQDEG